MSSTAIAESNTHLYFTSKGLDNFYTIYDKQSKESLSFRQLDFNKDFTFSLAPMYSYGDYLVAQVPAIMLTAMRNYMADKGISISNHLSDVYDNVDKEDNSVLVLIKFKGI